MDYLPFIDDLTGLDQYEDAVERAIVGELRDKTQQAHPEALSVTATDLRDYPIHSLDCATSNNEEELLALYRRSFPRVDLDRYTTQSDDIDTLCVMDSYLRHQELILQRLMPKTLLNQWAINNDFLNASSDVLEKVIKDQENNIHDLNMYRKRLQLQNKPHFTDLTNEWKRNLVDRLDEK